MSSVSTFVQPGSVPLAILAEQHGTKQHGTKQHGTKQHGTKHNWFSKGMISMGCSTRFRDKKSDSTAAASAAFAQPASE